MMKLDDLRQGVGTLWDSVTEGWERLRQGAAGALTRYRPEHKASLPTPDDVDDAGYMPSASWAMLGGDVFEDDKRIDVRLEAPGMNKSGSDIPVLDGALVVRGEKRFERESTEGTLARAAVCHRLLSATQIGASDVRTGSAAPVRRCGQRTVDGQLASTRIERPLSGFRTRERSTVYVRSTS